MLTLWLQGDETLNDTVSVYPRPDCGVPANQCMDLVLGRKAGAGQNQHSGRGGGSGSGNGNGNGGGSCLQSLMPLMKMMPNP